MEWYTKYGGSYNDYFFFKDKSVNPYISNGVRYELAGKTVTAYVGDDGKFTYVKKGDENGNVTDEKYINLSSPTISAINLSLASGGGNYNNIAPERSGGNSGNSNGGQNQPGIMTNIQYGVNGANSIANLGANLIANDLASEYLKGGSRQTLKEIAAAGESLEEAVKVTSVLEKL